MAYFISDLDKTLIFSGYHDMKSVEQYNDRNITFMTEKGFSLMQEVFANEKVTFIPCTMRNLHQTHRIGFIHNYNPKYIICVNGAEIYVDGILDEEWTKLMRERVSEKQTLELKELIDNLDIGIIENRNVNGFFLALKFTKLDLDKEIEELRKIIPNDYKIQQDKYKVFLLNKNIDKSHAITYLKEKYLSNEDIFIAGDSQVDELMTKLPYIKRAYIPKHATFKNEKAYQTKVDGIDATEEILTRLIKDLE